MARSPERVSIRVVLLVIVRLFASILAESEFIRKFVSTTSSKELSKSLCSQFINIINSNTNAYKNLNSIIESDYSQSFHIGILEQIETAIIRT